MPRYRCTNCNYVFELKPGKKIPKKCPYCAKENSLVPEKTAQELLDEVASE